MVILHTYKPWTFPLTVSLPQSAYLPCWRVHTYKQYIWRFYYQSAFSIVHFDRNYFTCSCKRERKSLHDFKFGTFTGRFPSDGAASMAVKELRAKTGLPVAYLILPLHMPALSCHWRRLQVQYGSTHGCVFRTFKGWFLIESKTDRGRGSERSCRINT